VPYESEQTAPAICGVSVCGNDLIDIFLFQPHFVIQKRLNVKGILFVKV
jgi:hypothetical protein